MSTTPDPAALQQPNEPGERSGVRFDRVRAHGALQAALMVVAMLVVLIALAGCASTPAGDPGNVCQARLQELEQKLTDVESRLARDEYALLAVNRHAVARADRANASTAPATKPTDADRDAIQARVVAYARQRVAAADRLNDPQARVPRLARGDAY